MSTAIGAGGYYRVYSERYEITRYDASGRLAAIFRRAWSGAPVQAQEFEDFKLAFVEEVAGRDPRLVQPLERQAAAMQAAEVHPALTGLKVDSEGCVWVRNYSVPQDGYWFSRTGKYPPPVDWSVFSADGEWLLDTRLPTGFELVEIAADRMLGLSRDSLDVPVVRVYRLTRGVSC